MTYESLGGLEKGVGQCLRGERQKRGLSLEEVGEKTGIRTNTLSRIERGQHRQSLSDIAILLDFYQIRWEDLFGNAEETEDIELARLISNFRKISRKDRGFLVQLSDLLLGTYAGSHHNSSGSPADS